MTRLASVLTLAVLAGCDALLPTTLFDPNVAQIETASLDASPADGDSVFVRLTSGSVTRDTEAAVGPFPLTLAVPPGLAVATTDGDWEGASLEVEVRSCSRTCATSESLGRTALAPDGWAGSERSVEVGGVGVTLGFRTTSS